MPSPIKPGPVFMGVSVAVIAAIIMVGVVFLISTQSNKAGSLGSNSRAQHVTGK